MKKLITLIGAFALLALVASPVSALEPQGSVAIAKDKIEVKVCNFNMGDIQNMVFTGSNSGLNHSFFGGSGTGSASAKADVGSELNSSSTGVAVFDFQSGPVALNQAEEHFFPWFPTPKGFALAEDETEVKVKNLNLGSVFNGVLTLANSGMNFTFGGDSTTGNASATSSLDTKLNTNDTCILVMEGGFGPTAMNLNSGGVAIAKDETEVEVSNKNLGMVLNMVGTSANTGLNLSFGGSSGTGNALALSGVTNNVNSNSTDVGVFNMSSGPVALNQKEEHKPFGEEGCGTPTCDPEPTPSCLPGLCSGAPTAANIGTSGTAVVETETEVGVSNTNIGEVTNVVTTSANTGGNTTVGCPGEPTCQAVTTGDTEVTPPAVSTGNADATSNVSNTVNTNSTTVVVVTGGSN